MKRRPSLGECTHCTNKEGWEAFGWIPRNVDDVPTEIKQLPDGRLELRIEHAVLTGIRPEMIVWWFQNIDGDCQFRGANYRCR